MAKIIGIDLGTTNSLVAIYEGNECQVIPNAEGSTMTPSVVGLTKSGERLVGELAKRQAISNPERTIVSIKRHMGTDYKVKIDDREYMPQEISAMILQKLKSDAEAHLGETITKAVLTVPAYFNDAERQATKDAGAIAGLEVVRIINEPTAAAMAYGVSKMTDTHNVLVFDLGGGTFDVSILTIDEGVFEVIATSGDMKLGGDDWDRRIMDYLIDEFKKSAGIDLRIDRVSMQRLKEAAEGAKWELSDKESTRVNLPFIAADPNGPKHLDLEFTRQKFEELTKDLVERLAIPAKQALEDAKIPLAQIHQIILVGGSTRMPMVQRMAQKLFMKEPVKNVDPENVVAMGAAIEAAVLAGEVKDLVLLDVTSLSIGIETTGGIFTRVIERNTQIPCSKRKIFTTVADNQTTVAVKVYQGERELAQHNKFLGSFELRNIPAAARAVPQIEVAFEIDTNGIVSVSAKDLASGTMQRITITSPTNLTQEEINRMIAEASQHVSEDAQIRDRRMTVNKAEVEIEVAEKTLKDYGQMFEAAKVDKAKMCIEVLKQALDGSTQEVKDLEKIKKDTLVLQDTIFNLTSELYMPAEKAVAPPPKDSKKGAKTDQKVTSLGSTEANETELMNWFKKQK